MDVEKSTHNLNNNSFKIDTVSLLSSVKRKMQ